MKASSECPSDLELEDLLADRVSPDVIKRLTDHIDGCETCQQRLDSSTDTSDLDQRLSTLDRSSSKSTDLERAIRISKSARSSSVGDLANTAELESLSYYEPLLKAGFKLQSKLGQGGMGIVYKAYQESLDRAVAVKILVPHLASDESARSRFLREARAASAIIHPNVITIHAVGEDAGIPYLVMEYVHGYSLQQKLDAGKRFSTENIVRIASQICAGLEAAHKKGIVHRDIKPANVFVNVESGLVLLGDFGLARALDNSRITQAGVLVGTPAFVAPEYLKGQGDHRADLFSLGVLMYELCSGNSPFQADSAITTLHRLSTEQPDPLGDDVPDWLAQIINRLLEKNPDQRFQSAVAVRTALRHGKTQEIGVGQTSVISNAKTDAQAGVNRRLSIAIAAIVVVFLVLGAFALRSDFIGGEKDEDGLVHELDLEEAFYLRLNESNDVHQKYRSLQAAVDDIMDGDVIEVWCNDDIEIYGRIHFEHEVTIAAGDDCRPTFVFHPSEEDEFDPMFSVEGEVTLVGLQIHTAEEIEDEVVLIHVEPNGRLEIIDCDLLNGGEEGVACVSSEGKLFVEDSIFHAPRSAAFEIGPLGTVRLENCWVSGGIAFDVSVSRNRLLRIDDCTIVCEGIFDIGEADAVLAIEASGSVFVGGQQTVFVGSEDPNEFDDNFSWDGNDNVFSGYLISGPELIARKDVEKQFNAWSSGREEEGNFVEEVFEIEFEDLMNAISEIDFRLDELEKLPHIEEGAMDVDED